MHYKLWSRGSAIGGNHEIMIMPVMDISLPCFTMVLYNVFTVVMETDYGRILNNRGVFMIVQCLCREQHFTWCMLEQSHT